ncbi:MAG: Hsp20/alpha crystallin family protein [Candidatus Omnitrophica bacterium]|nr:Hsp20/alpha crystallin family protein [Candidatus Omnitrophota bacterium]
MKNKIIWGAVLILAAAFLLENAYLMGRRSGEKARQKNVVVRYQPFPVSRPFENNPAIFMDSRARETLDEMNRLQERMQRLMDNSFYARPDQRNIQNRPSSSGQSFSDTDTAYIVKVSLPGFEKKDIRVRVEGGQLVVSAETKKDEVKKDGDSYAQASRYGDFLSTFMLPQDARADQITAEHKNGLLTITVPKMKDRKMRPSRITKIVVK